MLDTVIEVHDIIDQSSKEIEHHQAHSAVVGKDILELISVSMYVDPLTLYREYIQNATDAIDQAVAEGNLKDSGQGEISILISLKNRSVTIRDNGCGIKSKAFEKTMLSFGNSQKRGGKARGFRGVGRFSGLAYCQNLIFRTHAENEEITSEVKWDGRKFKQVLGDNESPKTLEKLVSEVATITTYKANKSEKPFFEIELNRVVRTKNDLLLNAEHVSDYVAQNCPVPYSSEFSFKDELEGFLSQYSVHPGYNISLSDDFTQDRIIFRPNRDSFSISETETDEISGIEMFSIEGVHEGISAIGWIYAQSYKGVIPLSANIRGIRVRAGNMQIGDEKILCDTFPELRFNSWSIGEIHILDEKIIPNGRRDNFDQNIHWLELQNKFSPYAKEIAKTCRRNSSERNAIKLFYSERERCEHLISTIQQGALSNTGLKKQKYEVSLSLSKLDKLAKASTISPNNQERLLTDLSLTRDKATSAYESEKAGDDFFDDVPKHKRGPIKEMFDLIYECSPNKIVAEALIEKIMTAYAAKLGVK